jgi:hypothetical protein
MQVRIDTFSIYNVKDGAGIGAAKAAAMIDSRDGEIEAS